MNHDLFFSDNESDMILYLYQYEFDDETINNLMLLFTQDKSFCNTKKRYIKQSLIEIINYDLYCQRGLMPNIFHPMEVFLFLNKAEKKDNIIYLTYNVIYEMEPIIVKVDLNDILKKNYAFKIVERDNVDDFIAFQFIENKKKWLPRFIIWILLKIGIVRKVWL